MELPTSKEIQKNENILISWTAREFVYHEKSKGWFVGLGILSFAFFIVALLMENYLFAFIIIITAGLIAMMAAKKPKNIKIAISNKGIYINDDHQSYEKISSFWIFEEDEDKKLSLANKTWPKIPRLVMLESQDPQTVREILKEFIEEREHNETTADIIAKKVQF